MFELRTGKAAYKQEVTTYTIDGTHSGKSETKFNSIGLHYKQFTGNSFYFRTGLDFNNYSYEFISDKTSEFKEYQNTFKAQALIANFTIGNQWQWENFTLGCDWIGYAVPISSSVTSQKISDYATNSSLDYLNSFKNELFKSPSIVLLRFYLGASF